MKWIVSLKQLSPTTEFSKESLISLMAEVSGIDGRELRLLDADMFVGGDGGSSTARIGGIICDILSLGDKGLPGDEHSEIGEPNVGSV